MSFSLFTSVSKNFNTTFGFLITMEEKNSYNVVLDPKEYFKNHKPKIFQKLGGMINR